MTSKRIFVLNGHPAATSLTRTMAQTYAAAAQKAGHEVRITHLHDIDFDMDYGFAGYAQHKPLEPCLAPLEPWTIRPLNRCTIGHSNLMFCVTFETTISHFVARWARIQYPVKPSQTTNMSFQKHTVVYFETIIRFSVSR